MTSEPYTDIHNIVYYGLSGDLTLMRLSDYRKKICMQRHADDRNVRKHFNSFDNMCAKARRR